MSDLISRSALKKACSEMVRGSNNSDFIPCPTWNNAMELIDNAPTVERPQGEWVDISKLRLMTVEECAGHTLEYAMGWKACVEWLKKGGAE